MPQLAIGAAELQLVFDLRHAAQELETEAAELVASGTVSPALAAAAVGGRRPGRRVRRRDRYHGGLGG